MASAVGIENKMETDFSDSDEPETAGEHHALLARSNNQSKKTNDRFLSAMAEDEENRRENEIDTTRRSKKSLGLSAIARYPKGVFFCLGNEFSERFSFYGMRAIFTLYLISVHNVEASTAKLLFHAFVSLAYFMPLFGSILADGFLGRYRVILYVSILYCFGHLLLTFGAAATAGSTVMKIFDFLGMFVIAVSMGGITPCVSAFAADQFPEHMYEERKQFFSFFYFSINVGALLSKIITPFLRRQHCLGHDTCFPLAFGVPAIFMFLATLIFWSGTRYYKIAPRKENVIVQVFKCVWYALRQRLRRSKTEGKSVKHWLDYARPKYDQVLIDDIKTIVRIVILYIPVVFFWSLFDQMGSTWVLQANAMNGRVGRMTILPDQMPVLNPLLIIVLVPVLEGFVYPLLAKGNFLVRPLRRMGWGGVLGAISFAMAGTLQLRVDTTAVTPPEPGFGRLVLVSYVDRPVKVVGGTNDFTIEPNDPTQYTVDANQDVVLQYRTSKDFSTPLPIKTGRGTFAIFFHSVSNLSLFNYDLKKTANGKTRLYAVLEGDNDATLQNYRRSVIIKQTGAVKGEILPNSTLFADLEPELFGSINYDVYLKSCLLLSGFENSDNSSCVETFLREYTAEMGAADVIVVRSDGSTRIADLIPANTISILWQVPQYLVLTLAEALFSITGLEFSYSQASTKMKSVMSAVWLLTSAFGNVIDIIISGSGIVKNEPAVEFFVYAAMMSVVMLAFIFLAWRYKSASEYGRSNPSLETSLDENQPEPQPAKDQSATS